jgi:hypothetical protein
MVVYQKMKTKYQAALIVAALILMPVFIILLADFINIIIVIVTFSLCFSLVAYYLYVDIKEELDWKKSEHERITHGFDAEKLRFYKFFVDFFNK